MSATDDVRVRLSEADARSLDRPVSIDVVRQDNGEVIESVTLLRYAGHYRANSVHAYAIKDSEGKFRVRGGFALGLTDASPFAAFVKPAPVDASSLVA